MSREKDLAKSYNAIAQVSIDAMQEKFIEYYTQAAANIIPKFEALYSKVLLAAKGRKTEPADLYHLDDYWILQKEIKQELEEFGKELILFSCLQYKTMFIDVYEGTAINGKTLTCKLSNMAIAKVIGKPWKERVWIERIWINLSCLYDGLFARLMEYVIKNGKNPNKLTALLQEEFEASRKGVNTIINTHSTVVQTHALAKVYRHIRKGY